MALYRKYRPKKLGELLGQETNVLILKNAAKQNRLGHAYLFYGPRGTGKCVKYDTLVMDAKSGEVMTIEQAYKRKNINLFTLDNDYKLKSVCPTAFIDDGIKPCFRVTTALGKSIEVTAVHPFLTIDGWKRLSELNVGDKIGLPRIIPAFGSSEMPEHQIKMLAYLISEGSLSSKKHAIGFTNSDPKLVRDFISAAEKFENILVAKYDSGGTRTPTYRVVQKKLRNWLNQPGMSKNSLVAFVKEFGLLGHKSATKFIPSLIFQLPKNSLALFLRTLFSGDGSIFFQSTPTVAYYSTSKKLVTQTQHLLLRFGIISRVKNRITKFNKKPYSSWALEITNRESLAIFKNDIGFLGEKAKRLAELETYSSTITTNPNLDTIPSRVYNLVYAAKNESGKTWNEAGMLLGYKTPKRAVPRFLYAPSRAKLRIYGEVFESEEVTNIANSDIYWDKITEIQYTGNYQVYDLTVAKTQNFVANDFIIHNTTTARLIAKLLNCERRRSDEEFRKVGEPCNECRECREIDAQTSFDVIEIDAASNRGIDEIKNLKESIRVSPSSAHHKVYIIDECLTADHLITLADGSVKKISEVKDGDEIFSVDLETGLLVPKKISNWFSRETNELIHIRTPQATLRCTPTHRMWVMRNGGFQLIQAKDIQTSDFLLSPIELPHYAQNDLEPDQLAFLALIQCDGHISKDSSTIQVEISKDVDYFVEMFRRGTEAWGFNGSFSLTKTKRGTTLLRYYSHSLKKKLVELSCPAGKKSNIIDIPDRVFQAPLESVRAYIDACFCCEGDASFTPTTRLYKLSFSTTSVMFAKKLQLLLKKFGIASSILEIERKNKRHHKTYRLNITGYDLRLFQNIVGLSIKRKADVFKNQLDHKEKQDGIPIQAPLLLKRKELNITYDSLYSRGVYPDKRQALTRQAVLEFTEIANTLEFNKYLQFRYEKILSIRRRYEKAKVCDFTVEGTHTFLANGICSSNCHMLTGPAFNALLKTLEEPPAHAVIVLATTEYEKLPATITSRAQRFLFKKLPKTKIMEKLAMIASAEKIQIDEPALELIAAAAEGSFRDAESLLDQISSLETKIDLQAVERITGRVGLKKVYELAELILKNDLGGSINYLSSIAEEGHNLVQLTKDLIHYFRKILSLKINPGLEKFFHGELTSDEIEQIKKLSAALKTEWAIKFLKSLIRAYGEIRYSPFALVPLEVALIENLENRI